MAVKLTRLDLDYILVQIEMAEAGQPPVNPLLSFGLREVAGTNNNLVPGQGTYGSTDQPFPTVTDPLYQSASYASTSGMIVDAQPRMISNLISDQTANNPAAVAAQAEQLSFLGAGYQNTTTPGTDGIYGAGYALTSSGADGVFGTDDDTVVGYGADHILNTLDDVVGGTRASLGLHTFSAGADGMVNTADDVLSDDMLSGNQATPTDASSSSSTVPGLAQSLFINNVTPDNGLSAPANSWFTFFGQFFDHGLDMIDKGGSGTVFIPLAPDDPLYVPGGHSNFMLLTRATNLPGPDGVMGTADDVHQGTNQTSPFVDQSQTYASDPSHQVFLREYFLDAASKPLSSGNLLGHAKADGRDGMATWADLKANAANFLGIQITDADVGNIPLLATDAYGKFIPGANGMPQIVVIRTDGTTALIEGNLANPIALDTADYTAVRTGHAFINDMAHSASPTDDFGNPLRPDINVTADPSLTPAAGFYDNELLDAHYVAGDGRVNENIGLTAVQDIFHSEHDRLVAAIRATIQGELDQGNVSFAGNWVLPGVDLTVPTQTVPGVNDVDAQGNPIHVIQPTEWNGERLFQAAKFGTETEYQHLVFEEFARYVAPSIHVAAGVNVHIDAAITSEFANVVYRFGHSMLDENVNLYVLGPDGKPVIDPATGQPQMTAEGLIQAFTNPMQFANDTTGNLTADIILGTVNQVSNSIDEFVTGTLRNNLLGLPLDLAALNITRGRDTGVAPLNLVRNQLYAQTGEAQLKAYVSWADFGSQLKHPESLVNFIAAYGTHASIVGANTAADKRAAAQSLVDQGTLGSPTFNSSNLDAYNFLHSQGIYANANLTTAAGRAAAVADARTIHDSTGAEAAWSTGSVTGVDSIDMWIGGLAEKINLFGGQLGSTFEYIFRTQLEALQDGDRLYYLPRIEGMDYEESLQDSSLAQLIRANTDIKHLPGNIFLTPEYTIEASDYFVKATGTETADAQGFKLDGTGHRIATDPSTWLKSAATLPDGSHKLLVDVQPDGTVQFLGDDNFLGNTIVLGGTEGDDRLVAGAADDDTVWGDGGNDYLDGGGGNDFLFGGDGNDTLVGNQGDDTLHGDAGNDTIYGGDGLDTIFGGDGNDYIEGGRGDDVIMGGLGNDIIIGNEGADELTGDGGDDWLESRGGQGQLMFGDSGAPTGGVPLYSGNDVMIGGVAGGDVMKGFSGDDIMVGEGSFTKFIGGLGFDWGSYEFAPHGVSEDMNRKEFVSPIGAEDTIRDIWQHTEGASGSAFDDFIIGSNDTKLLTTKDELDNANLITGLASFFDPGPVLFEGGNILLGGSGNDTITGGGGNDIIDGDAWLHVALTSYTAGGQIIRQIAYDPNGNTYDATAAQFTLDENGLVVPGSFVAGTGHVNPANVDIAIYNDVLADYDIALFGKDNEGFLTVDHARVGAPIAGGNPQGLLGGNDGVDRIRNIERLQFTDATVAIDANGNMISSSFAMPFDPNYATLYEPFYDAVPVGKPVISESGGLDPATTVTIGQTLTANVATIADYDGITTAIRYQWQALDLVRGEWTDIVGANADKFVPTLFQNGTLGLRVKASYVDGKGYTETLISAPTATVTLPGNVNTAPTIVTGQQYNGISDTTALMGAPFDFFSPFTSIFTDNQTAANALTYSATLADGSSLASVGMTFTFDPVTGAGEFSAPNSFVDPDGNPVSAGQLAVRVTATDTPPPGTGPALSVTNTFFINILPQDTPPVANNDSYSILENAALSITKAVMGPASTVTPPNTVGVLANDTDADFGDRLTAQLVSGPAHGTLQFNNNGTFIYTPNLNYAGTDSFTYVANDAFLTSSNVATASITVTPVAPALTATLLHDTGASNTDRLTNDATLTGSSFPNAAVFASVNGGTPVQFATADATGAWSGTPVLADGPQTIVITATDGDPASPTFGKTATQTVSFTLDTTPPPLAATLLSDTGASATDFITSLAGLTGLGDPNGSVSLVVDGGPAIVVATGNTGTWAFTPVLTDGLHTIVVTGSTDLAGNTATGTLSFTLDTVAPSVTEGLAHDSGVSATDLITNDDTIAGTGDPNATVFASIDGGALVAVTSALADGSWSFKPALADGNHTVAIRGTDLAGNIGQATLSFSLDTTAPAVTVTLNSDTGVSATDGITSVATVKGTGDPNATVQVSVDGILAGSIATNATGNWIFVPPLTVDGTHIVSVTGSDLAGNSTTANLTFTLDTSAPAAPSIGNFTYVTNAATNTLTSYTISGTAEAGSTVVLSNGAVLGTATAAANGSWSFTVAPVPASNIVATLSLTATDVAGNKSGAQQIGLLVGTGAANTLAANGLNAGIPNVLIGMAGSDTLTGSTGNDRLDGGAGSDLMTGGLGDDTYVVDAAGDVVVEAPNGGTDTVLTSLAAYTLTANVENLTYTGVGNFTGTGNVLANVITGGVGNDTLNDGGGSGIDTLNGGAGNDTYVVSNADDVIVEAAGGGTDTVRTSLAAYTLTANLENLTYTGAGNFAGTGNTLANVITGGAGNDTLDDGGGAGADRLIGGAGNDTYIVSNAGDVLTELAGGGTDTVQTTLSSYTLLANLENLTYTGAGNFTGTGNTLANVITGGSGNDTLSDGGGAGVDTLRGGLGDDTYIVANAGDLIQDTGGIDTVRTALASYTLGTGLDNLVYTGAAAFTGTGNALANVITGGAANDTLNDGGGSGIDTLTGGLGNDTYIVSNAGEVNEAAGGGTDTVRTAMGAYTLDANVENLVYTGSASFAGTGNALVNSISGGIGNDILDGGKNTTGADTMIGGGGDDTYVINNVGDVVTEAAGAGNDTANVLINSYTLATNVEVLNFIGTGAFSGTGNALANVMTGGAGADTLNGAGGDDRLIGGAGADTLIGGAGNDIFVLVKGDANGDLIADFSRAGLNNTDQILLSGYGAGASLLKTVVGNATTPTSYAVQVGGVTQDTFRLTGNITLGANDFHFV